MDNVHGELHPSAQIGHEFSLHNNELLLSDTLVTSQYNVSSLKNDCSILQNENHPEYLSKSHYIPELPTDMTLNVDLENRYRENRQMNQNYSKTDGAPSYEMKSLNHEIQNLTFPDDLRSLNRESTSTFEYYSKSMSPPPDIYNSDFPNDFSTNNFSNSLPSTSSIFHANDISSYVISENQTDDMLLSGMVLNDNDKLLLSDELALLTQGKSGSCLELTLANGEILYAVLDQENEFGSPTPRLLSSQKDILAPRPCSLPVSMESDLSQLSDSHYENSLPAATNYTIKPDHQPVPHFTLNSRHYHSDLPHSMSKPISSTSLSNENFNLCCDYPTTVSNDQFSPDVSNFSPMVSKERSSFSDSSVSKSDLTYTCTSTISSSKRISTAQSSSPILVNHSVEQTTKRDYFPSAVNSIVVSETGKKYPKKYSFYSNNFSSYLNQDSQLLEKNNRENEINPTKLCDLPQATSAEASVQDLSLNHSICSNISSSKTITQNEISQNSRINLKAITSDSSSESVSSGGKTTLVPRSSGNKIIHSIDLINDDDNDDISLSNRTCFVEEPLLTDEDKLRNKLRNSRTASVVNSICDQAIQSRAKATLPSTYLRICRVQKRTNELKPSYGIFARLPIPSQTRFGPIEGVLIKSEDDENDCKRIENEDHAVIELTIQKENGKHMRLDVSDENMSNWMRFVRPAKNYKEQNMILHQDEYNLYFTTIEIIHPDEELLVWYSAEYSHSRNLKLLPDDPYLIISGSDSVTFQFSSENINKFRKFVETSKTSEKTIFNENPKPSACVNSNCLQELIICNSDNIKESNDKNDPSTRTDIKKLTQNCDKLNKKLWLCNCCDLSFTNKTLMNIHVLEHTKDNEINLAAFNDSEHESSEQNTCPQCSKKFEDQKKLISHVSKHGLKVQKWKNGKSTDSSLSEESEGSEEESDRKFPCKYCTKKLKTAGALNIHERRVHSDESTIACPICDANFEKLAGLKEHIPTHAKDGIFSCPHCPKTYDQYKFIRKHIRAYHASASHICKQCKKGFRCLSKLKTHMLRHSNLKAFLCPTCGKQFKRADKLTGHIKNIHSEEREKINEEMMKAIFANKANKNASKNKRVSKKVKRIGADNVNNFFFKCYICEIGFKRRGMLVNHLSSLHPDISWNTIPELNVPILKACCQFFCQYCDKVYKSKSKRKEHILKSHPGLEVPRDTARGSTMNDPYAKHVKNLIVDPFSCEYCHRQYASRAKLLHHHRTHHEDLLPTDKKVTKSRSPRKRKKTPAAKLKKLATDVIPDLENNQETVATIHSDLQMSNVEFQISTETVNITTPDVISVEVIKDNEYGPNDSNQITLNDTLRGPLAQESYLKIFQIPVTQNDENSTVLQQFFTSYNFPNGGMERM